MSRFDQNKPVSSGMTSQAIQDDKTAPSIDETFVFSQELAAPPLATGDPLFQNHYALNAPNAHGRADDALFFHDGQGTLPCNDVSHGLLQQSQYRPDAPFDFGGIFSIPHDVAHAQQSVGPWIPNGSVNDYTFPQQQMFLPTVPQNFAAGFDNVFQQNEHRAPQPDPFAFDVFSLPFTPQSVNPHPPVYVPQQTFQPFRFAPAAAATYECQQRGYQAVSHPSDLSLVTHRPAPLGHGALFTPNTSSLNSIGVRGAPTSGLSQVHTRHPAGAHAPLAGPSRTSMQHVQQPPVASSSTLASSYSNQEYYQQGLNLTLELKNNLSSERTFREYCPGVSTSGTTSSSASGSTSQAPANQPGTEVHKETDETNAGTAPTSDTPLRCCGETFGRRKDLLRHLTSTSAHCDTKTQPVHYCAYCWNSSSMRKDNVRRHFKQCPKFNGTRRMGPRGKVIYDGKISRVTKAEAKWLKALSEGRL